MPFADQQDYGSYTSNDCVVLYGSHGYVSKCNKGFVPGAFGINSNFNCNVYYTKIPDRYLLNADTFLMVPWGTLKNDFYRLTELYGSNCLFVRPNSGFKTFAGQVLNVKFLR